MTHTVDTLINLIRRYGMACYNQANPEHFNAEAKDSIFLELHAALTEALAQPVREPLTDDDISYIWDSWLINITDKISAIQFAREIEREHHIGGDK